MQKLLDAVGQFIVDHIETIYWIGGIIIVLIVLANLDAGGWVDTGDGDQGY